MNKITTILTNTSDRFNSIKNSLLASENDGDTEDDTHICRVLRAYYVEKGRSFPAWLPPDPKAPPPAVVQPVYANNPGSRYGGMNAGPGATGGAGSQMRMLWDSPSNTASVPPTQSLRAGRGRMAPGGGPAQNPFRSQTPQPRPQATPLPSARAGSYQSYEAPTREQTPPINSGGLSAKDRFKAKNGGRAGLPARNGERSESYGSQGSSGGESAYVGSNSPWASGDGYSGGGDAYEAPLRKPQGLPSGPGAGRRGVGLPSRR